MQMTGIFLTISSIVLVSLFPLETAHPVDKAVFVSILCVMASTITALLNKTDKFWFIFRVWIAGCLGGVLSMCLCLLVFSINIGKTSLLSIFISLAISQIVSVLQKASAKLAEKRIKDLLGGDD